MLLLVTAVGDITKYPADVIVNAANSSLLGGGGVDGAIHRAAGPKLLAECRTLHGAKIGEAKMTGAHNIKTAKRIIHTPGPVYTYLTTDAEKLEAAQKLADCYQNSLTLASQAGAETIVFPAISTGIYGYPLREATAVAITAIGTWFEQNQDTSLMKVTLIGYDQQQAETIAEILGDPAAIESS